MTILTTVPRLAGATQGVAIRDNCDLKDIPLDCVAQGSAFAFIKTTNIRIKGWVAYTPVALRPTSSEQAASAYYLAGKARIEACIRSHPNIDGVDTSIFAACFLAALQTNDPETPARSAAVLDLNSGRGSAAAGGVIYWVPAIEVLRGTSHSILVTLNLLIVVQPPFMFPA